MLITTVLAAAATGPLCAERPPTAKLLPENTVILVSVPDAQELATKFMNSNLGRMTQDPQLKPLVEHVHGSLGKMAAEVTDAIGLSLSELLLLCQGEITYALIAPEDAAPQNVFLLDAGDQIHNARKLLESVVKGLEQGAKEKREETVAGVKMAIFKLAGSRITPVFFEKDSTIVVATSLQVAQDLLAAWDGENKAPLSENPHFATIMSRCRGRRGETPQIIGYIDPVGLLRSIAVEEPGVRFTLAMMPSLGLDGISALGGSILFDEDQFDSVFHMHLALESPRSGIVKMIALQPGSTKPEYWVPADVSQYMTCHWDFDTTIETLAQLIDSYFGEGTFDNFLENQFRKKTDIDLQKEVLSALEGRITYIVWIQKPITIKSQQTLVALKLKETESVEKALEKLQSLGKEQISKESYAGKMYYRQDIAVPEKVREEANIPTPCFGVLGDYLLIAYQPGVYQEVLLTAEKGEKSLADELDFKLIMSKIKQLSGGTKPAMVSFERGDESFRYLYELVQNERSRRQMMRPFGRTPFFKKFESALEENPLPPFAVLQKYLAPSGSTITDDETGIHLMSFTLKRKAE